MHINDNAIDQNIHNSWLVDDALQLNNTIRFELNNQQLMYVAHTQRILEHPITCKDVHYVVVSTYAINSKHKKAKTHYCCINHNNIDYKCQQTKIFDKLDRFLQHVETTHQPLLTTCTICSKQLHTSHYQTHYRKCSQQSIEQSIENNILDIDIAAEDDLIDDSQLDDSIDELVDLNITRNRKSNNIDIQFDLLDIEELHYYTIVKQTDSNNNNIQYKQWHPNQCSNTSTQCNIQRYGTYTRFCFDVSQPFLLQLQRYRCTTHNEHINSLSKCVNTQITQYNVRKTLDVMQFEQTVITYNLYYYISSIGLVTLNDSHISTIIKHAYRRAFKHKQTKHYDNIIYQYNINNNTTFTIHDIDSIHKCTAVCYGLDNVSKADKVMQIYNDYVYRALDIATTNKLHHLHIVPQSVLLFKSTIE